MKFTRFVVASLKLKVISWGVNFRGLINNEKEARLGCRINRRSALHTIGTKGAMHNAWILRTRRLRTVS